jgi:hypothetical protein
MPGFHRGSYKGLGDVEAIWLPITKDSLILPFPKRLAPFLP